MKIAVLPFNAGPDTEPAVARQTSAFVGEIVRQVSNEEVNPVSYIGRTEEDGMPRLAHVNPSESLNEPAMISEFFERSDTDLVMDGLLTETSGGGGKIVARWHAKGKGQTKDKEYAYLGGGMLTALRALVNDFLAETNGALPEDFAKDESLFGTDNAEAFRKFLIGYDATQYLERAQGMVLSTFEPETAFTALQEATVADRDWEAPFLTLIELSRLCTVYQKGTATLIEKHLRSLIEMEPKDARPWFALGNLLAAAGKHDKAAEAFEKAFANEPQEPAILLRLAQEQIALNMPVNAERNLRKAIELEGDDKPSMDLLAAVLTQTGRAHEVPELWKELADKSPTNALVRAKYAATLYATGKKEKAIEAFDSAIAELEDATVVKRVFAPIKAQEQDFDRAMDLYEDVLDASPTDVSVLSEYAQVLSAADRDFEVPKVLKDLLAAGPDPNTRAMALAWLCELEQPLRIEAVKAATERAESGDFEGALAQLKPLKTWLADYWKIWALLASIQNNLKNFEEAESCARKTLELYPACEPVYGELCTSLSGQGRDQEAYALMKIAISNLPNSLLIAVNYALAAKRAGDREEALRIARQIREATKDAAEVRQILQEIES